MGKTTDQKFGPFWPPRPGWTNLIKIFSLFKVQTNRPRASPASFQHVGQAPYSRGIKYGENRPLKNLGHLGLQDWGGRT